MRRQDALTCKPTPMWRKALAWITSLAMALMFVPAVAIPLPAWADDAASNSAGVTYLDADGNEQTCENYVEVAGITKMTQNRDAYIWDCSSEWYVVSKDTTIGLAIVVNKPVNLILKDNCSLTISGGIRVKDAAFTVYAQSTSAETMGSLSSTAKGSRAGIGSNDTNSANGTITINGGKITALGKEGAAGIGASQKCSCSDIIINGGIVDANGGSDGAGIGAGRESSAKSGNITIAGGVVRATGESNGAGIGAGSKGFCGNISINGAVVNATGGQTVAGIGKGASGTCGEIHINDGAIVRTGSISDKSYASSWNAIVFEGNEGKLYGSEVTPSTSLEIDAGKTMTLELDQKLVIPSGQTLTNNGAVMNKGVVEINGSLVNNGTITSTGTITNNGIFANKGDFGCSGTINGTNVFSISFETCGGIINDSYQNVYIHGMDMTLPTQVSKDGYSFAGWYENNSYVGNAITTISENDTGNKTFYAKWAPISYTVEFDANGGEGKMNSQTFTYDVAKKLTANSFTKSGYYLSGWKDVATGKIYSNEQEVMNLAVEQDAVVKLQAQWSIPYTPSPAPDPKPDPKPDPTPEPGMPGTEVSGTDDSGNKVSGTVVGNDEVELPSGGKADGSIEFTGTAGSGSGSDGSGGSEPSAPTVSVKVPETVTMGDKTYAVVKVADNAFAGQKELTEVTLPETIAEIGKNAFENTGIEKIELPGSVSSIGDNAFANTPLETIAIPKTVSSIGKNAFKGCEKLKDVDMAESSITEIASGAFAGTGIESVELPNTAKTIGTGAFENCKDLVFAETSAVKIGTRAFAYCENLKKATSKAKTIGKEAFKGCSSLVKVDISKATQIGDKVFSGCKDLKKATLGTGLKTIGKEAFKGCSDLKSVTITSKQLSKKQIAQCLKGSKVERILVQVGSKKQNQKYADKYAKLFTKKVAGKKVSVKAAKKPLKKK